ncbi:putative short-chain dehydrogenase [Cadophora sp. MPI-SDFR-AT-0126]|nr:putative short-chain dehydrogenase [Leotiomycetes sp. MPI-SDFR-AT-0126]
MTPETLSLAGKTAIVTGSGRENGIGAAIARALARNGANVAIHYVSESSKARAEKVAGDIEKEFGTKTVVISGGIESLEGAEGMVRAVLGGLGSERVDILVNNAAASQPATLLEVKKEQLEYEFSVNVFGTIYMTQAVVKVGKMPKGGRIINIGTIASKLLVAPTVYSTTKAAMDALTTLFAGELGHTHGITVNTLAPGPILTDLSEYVLVNPDGSPSEMQKSLFAQTRAEARLGEVKDLADATLLLVSEKSRWITGQHISVSGGITGV